MSIMVFSFLRPWLKFYPFLKKISFLLIFYVSLNNILLAIPLKINSLEETWARLAIRRMRKYRISLET